MGVGVMSVWHECVGVVCETELSVRRVHVCGVCVPVLSVSCAALSVVCRCGWCVAMCVCVCAGDHGAASVLDQSKLLHQEKVSKKNQ